jgi:hypothetical protein
VKSGHRPIHVSIGPAHEAKPAPINSSGGGSGGVLISVFDDHWGLVEQNFRLRSVSLCDRALPGIGIETLRGVTSVPEINASSGLIISVKIVFPYKPRDPAIVWRGLLEHRLRVIAGGALRKPEANDCGDHCNLLQLMLIAARILLY